MENIHNIMEVIKSVVAFLAMFGITFEILPVKISPLKWFGNKLNKSVNERIDKIEEHVKNIEYENDMKDLRSIKSRIHTYGMLIRKGEQLSYETLKSAMDDLDVYDSYKEQYQYMTINGRKIKINGEVETDRQLIIGQMTSIK